MTVRYKITAHCDLCDVLLSEHDYEQLRNTPMVQAEKRPQYGMDLCDRCAQEMHEVVHNLRELHGIETKKPPAPDQKPIQPITTAAQMKLELQKAVYEARTQQKKYEYECFAAKS